MQRFAAFVASDFVFHRFPDGRPYANPLSHDRAGVACFDRRTGMSPEDYIKQRVDDQIDWHSKKSSRNRKIYQGLTLLAIIAAACIPLLSAATLLGDEPGVAAPLAAGVLGVLITILSGTLSLFRFHENWVEYRLIVEALKRERFLFLAGVTPYDPQSPEKFTRFVENIEGMIAKTVISWGQTAQRPVLSRDPKKAGGVRLAGDGEG
ncbi:MAG: DUF4231 domain-containing protein [bacterium]|nr:DUF4231 domain-containing protein [bacterium]